jgi:hypothetical protein
MKSRLLVGLALTSTLFLAACPQPPAQPDVAQASEEAATLQSSAGAVRAALNGGAEVTMPASECVIVNDGANGVVRAAEGAFELSWADGAYRVIWSSEAGLYNGDVAGAVDGASVTFNGSAGGQSIAGAAACG